MSKHKVGRRHSAAKAALLVVGEGPDDKAFLNHIKSLYYVRGCGYTVKVEAGDGGSPGNIITNAIRSFKAFDYKCRFIVLDSDLPPTAAEIKKAERAGYTIIQWEPQCLEGSLLEVLGEKVNEHETSQNLKSRLHAKISGKHTDPNAYASLFTKSVLEAATNDSVKAVISALNNES